MVTTDFPFDHAIVRFSCLQPKGEQVPHLVFASVEMLPRGRSVPDETPLDDKGFPPSLTTKAGRLSFRRVALTAEAALNWYRSIDSLPDASGPYVGSRLTHSPLADEPAWSEAIWPALVVPIPPPTFPGAMEDDRIDPFTGANREAVRVHRRLTVGDPAVDALRNLPDEVKHKAFDWLRLRTWVDFGFYPELLGSVALIVPDPELRKLRARLDRDEEAGKTIVVDPDWRATPDKPIQLVLRERRHGGLAYTKTFSLDHNGPVKIHRPQPVEQISYEVYHPIRGVIAAMPMTGFVRSIGMQTSLIERTVSIKGKDGRGKSALSSTRNVQQVSDDSSFRVGAPLTPIGRLSEGAETRRSIRASTTELWLDDPTRSRDVIHKLLMRAQNSIMLVDPYADGLDLAQYGASSARAKIRMLTAEKSAEGTETEAIRNGTQRLRELNLNVEVRRMPGAALHDRFLLIDDAVWLLGASLNGLGSQATMLVRLGAPRPVRLRLEQIWAEAIPTEAEE